MKSFILLLSILLLAQVAFSNGGVINRSHFRKTGNIRLLRKADISLIKEDLNIKVVGDFTEIEVEYTLLNKGGKQDVQYGFPVDAYEQRWGGDTYPPFTKYNECQNFFKAFSNGERLKVSKWVIDSLYYIKTHTAYGRQRVIDFGYGNPEEFAVSRQWSAITLNFDKGEVKKLKIQYKVHNNLGDIIAELTFLPRYSERRFTYDLKPSSSWGDGIVKDFNVTIDVSDLVNSGSKFSITGLDSLKEEEGKYILKTTGFDLNQSDRININYNRKHIFFSQFLEKKKLPESIIKSIKASSGNDSIQNLIDNSATTSWTGKAGDWIEFTLNKIPKTYFTHKDFVIPYAIVGLNGDYSSQERFDKSGKLLRAKVILNDSIVYSTNIRDPQTPIAYNSRHSIIKFEKPCYVQGKYIMGSTCQVSDHTSLVLFRSRIITKIRIELLASDENADDEITLSELVLLGREIKKGH